LSGCSGEEALIILDSYREFVCEVAADCLALKDESQLVGPFARVVREVVLHGVAECAAVSTRSA
jgi:hypothetical protein